MQGFSLHSSCSTSENRISIPYDNIEDKEILFPNLNENNELKIFPAHVRKDDVKITLVHSIFEIILESNKKLYVTPNVKFFNKDFIPINAYNLSVGDSLINIMPNYQYRVLSRKEIKNPYYKTFSTNKELHKWREIGGRKNGIKIITEISPYKHLFIVNDILVRL